MSKLRSYSGKEVPMERHLAGGIGGLLSARSPYGVPQDAVGDSGEVPLEAVAAS